jgi:hypothetical protein
MRKNMNLSRISKLWVDRDELPIGDARAKREHYAVSLLCGPDVCRSRTLQLAVLTAASIATRCFPGAVKVFVDEALTDPSILVPPLLKGSLIEALSALVGPQNVLPATDPRIAGKLLLFGDAPSQPGALRATFDGWVAQVGPAATTPRLPERPFCALAGVLAGALAMAEIFLAFAELNIIATRRTTGLSLWRPDLQPDHPDALGPQVEVLPRELWVLGLGHLGNAYLWSLAALPYKKPEEVRLCLNDFDDVEAENVETGLLFTPEDEGQLKTRICSRWLEARSFRTRLVERPFDSDFQRRQTRPQIEPPLALCGFDSNEVRRKLPNAGFAQVIDTGLGGTKDNFETIGFHTWPNPRSADDLWPDPSPEEQEMEAREIERIAQESSAYGELGDDVCGRAELAGKSVAVPFVGVTAATLAVAEIIRLLHDGPAYSDIKLSLSDLSNISAIRKANYTVQDLSGLSFSDKMIHP